MLQHVRRADWAQHDNFVVFEHDCFDERLIVIGCFVNFSNESIKWTNYKTKNLFDVHSHALTVLQVNLQLENVLAVGQIELDETAQCA